jgi:hypothetical protein
VLDQSSGSPPGYKNSLPKTYPFLWKSAGFLLEELALHSNRSVVFSVEQDMHKHSSASTHAAHHSSLFLPQALLL